MAERRSHLTDLRRTTDRWHRGAHRRRRSGTDRRRVGTPHSRQRRQTSAARSPGSRRRSRRTFLNPSELHRATIAHVDRSAWPRRDWRSARRARAPNCVPECAARWAGAGGSWSERRVGGRSDVRSGARGWLRVVSFRRYIRYLAPRDGSPRRVRGWLVVFGAPGVGAQSCSGFASEVFLRGVAWAGSELGRAAVDASRRGLPPFGVWVRPSGDGPEVVSGMVQCGWRVCGSSVGCCAALSFGPAMRHG